MKQGRQIDLLLPGLFWREAIGQLNDRGNRPKGLERILSRARRNPFPGADLTGTLFQLFGIASEPHRDLPAGAVVCFGMNGDPGDGCRALATPVHLLADRDRLLLIRLAPEAIRSEHAEELAAQFNAHFKHDGLSLAVMSPNQWCLSLSGVPEITTSNIESVSGRHIEEYLPKGKDAPYWRKVLNETQMLFFQNETNQAKAASGELTVNALWLSGVGVRPDVHADYGVVHAGHPLAVGLARLSNIPSRDLPGHLADISRQEGKILIVMTDLLEAELDADSARWLEALDDTESKLGQLLQTIDFSRDEVAIYPCQGQSYHAGKSVPLLSFFRRNKNLNQLLNDCET